jgi:hypothetical protein
MISYDDDENVSYSVFDMIDKLLNIDIFDYFDVTWG